jgi:hypothetical protein
VETKKRFCRKRKLHWNTSSLFQIRVCRRGRVNSALPSYEPLKTFGKSFEFAGQ